MLDSVMGYYICLCVWNVMNVMTYWLCICLVILWMRVRTLA